MTTDVMRCLGALLVLLAWCSPAQSGYVYEVETTRVGAGKASATRGALQADGRRLLMLGEERPSEGLRPLMIFRGDHSLMHAINHRDETVMTLDEATLKRLEGFRGGGAAGSPFMPTGMSDAMMNQLLERVPPEKREQVKALMEQRSGQASAISAQPPGAGAMETEYVETDEQARKMGYPCRRVDVMKNGIKDREIWVTDWKHVEGGKALSAAVLELADFHGRLIESLPGAVAKKKSVPGVDAGPLTVMKELNGFPVMTRRFVKGEVVEKTVLKSAVERDLDAAAFEPPADYHRRGWLQ